MYHHVSDCIRLDSIVSYGLSPCQAMSGRHWLGILLAAPDQDNLHWAVGVHLSVFIPLPPLAGSRSLCLCMCGWCVSAQIQASCVCTMSKSEWRVFFGLPDSPSLSLSFFSCQHCWYVWKSSSRAWQNIEWALLYPRGGPGFSPYDWTQWNLQCPGHLCRTETIHGLSFSGWWGRRTSTEQLGFAMLQLYWRQICIGKCMRLYAFVCVLSLDTKCCVCHWTILFHFSLLRLLHFC